jgi:adenylyl-sulfate kinase
VVVWLTGLPAAGKTTIADALARRLRESGHRVTRLDADEVRASAISRDLGYSPEDRREHLLRVASIAKPLSDGLATVVCSFVSPSASVRDEVRRAVGNDRFIEVFVDCPVSVCIQRDPKGLYRKALAGEIPDFTGVSAAYEAPTDPEVHVRTDRMTVEGCVKAVLEAIPVGGGPRAEGPSPPSVTSFRLRT